MIDERRRHDLFLRLEQVLGTEEASTLMEHLPPVGWSDLATKADLDGLRAATKADLEELRTATKADLGELRAATKADLEELRTATKADLGELRTATKADLNELRTATRRDLDVSVELLRFELRTDIAQLETRLLDRMRTQTWTLFTALVIGMGLAGTLGRV